MKEEIKSHLLDKRVVQIRGETGCGKSTRIPLFVKELYDEGKFGNEIKDLKMLVTQPRRVAAKSL